MQDESLFHKVLGNLYAAPLKPELWTVALRDITRVLSVHQIALIEHRPAEDRHCIFAFTGDQIKEGGRLYEQHYWQFDEWTKRILRRPKSGEVFYGEAVWPEADLRRSVFFNEFLVKYDACQLLAVHSDAGPSGFDTLSVLRGLDEPEFEESQYRALCSLSPHVDIALATRRRLVDLQSKVSDLESALNQVRVALILLDGQGRPLMVNSAAQEICNRCDGVFLSGSGITAASPKECAELRALIDRTVGSVRNWRNAPQGGAVLVSKRSGQRLHLLVTPVPPGLVDVRARRAAAILLISDPEKNRWLPDHILRQLFCLTPAECRLALLLLGDITPPEAADRLGVSRETVRSQLKAILQKTGTRRQGELLKLLMGISTLGG